MTVSRGIFSPGARLATVNAFAKFKERSFIHSRNIEGGVLLFGDTVYNVCGRTAYVSMSNYFYSCIQLKGLLYDAERDLFAIAMLLVNVHFNRF